ncbi:hypothetical protein PROFUN_06476 [Planoprotostelium fungivorum]|uniref:Uncharacterized protein n=1 Tax=Planoprotostelium fungivorum TaxID=1890364 RepID=A0A2P6MR20_9EUKA|nr:hypothetical protein PROFUN_06476 [Planoprotostelium fungivorum]
MEVDVRSSPITLSGPVGNETKWYRWDYYYNQYALPREGIPVVTLCSENRTKVFFSMSAQPPTEPSNTWSGNSTAVVCQTLTQESCAFAPVYVGVLSGDKPYSLTVSYRLNQGCNHFGFAVFLTIYSVCLLVRVFVPSLLTPWRFVSAQPSSPWWRLGSSTTNTPNTRGYSR